MSWTQGPVDLSGEWRRKGYEKRLLWRYRKETARSVLADHSRATDRLNVVDEDRTVPPRNFFPACSPPIGPQGHAPCNTEWMGRVWTHLVPQHLSPNRSLVTRQKLKGAFGKDLKGFCQR